MPAGASLRRLVLPASPPATRAEPAPFRSVGMCLTVGRRVSFAARLSMSLIESRQGIPEETRGRGRASAGDPGTDGLARTTCAGGLKRVTGTHCDCLAGAWDQAPPGDFAGGRFRLAPRRRGLRSPPVIPAWPTPSPPRPAAGWPGTHGSGPPPSRSCPLPCPPQTHVRPHSGPPGGGQPEPAVSHRPRRRRGLQQVHTTHHAHDSA